LIEKHARGPIRKNNVPFNHRTPKSVPFSVAPLAIVRLPSKHSINLEDILPLYQNCKWKIPHHFIEGQLAIATTQTFLRLYENPLDSYIKTGLPKSNKKMSQASRNDLACIPLAWGRRHLPPFTSGPGGENERSNESE
jgi:hypothetical protein